MQIVDNAIIVSIATDNVVHIEPWDILTAGHSPDAVRESLQRECAGSQVKPDCVTYWGMNADGHSWRVHVTR